MVTRFANQNRVEKLQAKTARDTGWRVRERFSCCVSSRYRSPERLAERAICCRSEKILPGEGKLTSRHDVCAGGMGDNRRAG